MTKQILHHRVAGRSLYLLGLGAFALSVGTAQAASSCTTDGIESWGTGFVVRGITVTNNSGRTISPLRIELRFDEAIDIDETWGGSAERDGMSVTLTGNEYNTRLGDGRTARFGFKGVGRPDKVTCTVLNGGDAGRPSPVEPPREDTTPSSPVAQRPASAAPVVRPAPSGGLLLDRDMDELPSGFHDDASWKSLWRPATWASGPDEGRVFVDDRVQAGNTGKSVRVLYPVDRRTSSDSGAQWHMGIGDVAADELYLAYWVRFDDDFDFVLGGKLPGFSGSVSFRDRTHEWSGRLMWREEGKVEFYTHIAGERERWWWNTEGVQMRFVPGQWHHLEMRFEMNTPGQANGSMEGWFDGVRAASYDDVEFRAADEADSRITRVFFSTFFGGSSGPRWDANKNEFAWFDGFSVSRERIGYPGPVE